MSSDIFLLAMVSMEIDICSKEKEEVGGKRCKCFKIISVLKD